ncbi:hypothetical protein ABIE26_004481 [Pedobacter africanus]|uniref:Uncharacterized protein n=1 Tax=Pedobacter africanus TaxID=151894 RepID=A0ACC6L3H9_9SPHI|nr:hypothetical protein [Pedobacter africanus]MDR6786049.1 hypothetical protein [Pedobacter africanus]
MPQKNTITDLAAYIWQNIKKSTKLEYRIPPSGILEELFETLYFASMNSEEGELIKVRVAFYNPNEPVGFRRTRNIERYNYIPFGKPMPYDVKSIVKLSKSADPWSSSLAVYFDDDQELQIYGLIDQAVHTESYLNRESTTKPDQAGLFQVSIIGIGSLSVIREYDLIATFKQNILVTQFLDVLRFGPISRLLKAKAKNFTDEIIKFIVSNDFDVDIEDYEPTIHNIWRDTLSRILIHIRNYRHGGAFLISAETTGLKINYTVSYDRLHKSMARLLKWTIACDVVEEEISILGDRNMKMDLFNEYLIGKSKKKSSENELKGAIRFIASHSCVDGLILFDDDLFEQGYGVFVQDLHAPKYIYQATDNTGTESLLVRKSLSHYGTRHQSMISFCYANEGSIGFVVSQDGDIRAFTKAGDKLIMWESIKTHKYLKSAPSRRLPTTRLKSL